MKQIQRELVPNGINFEYNVAFASHRNGSVERIIKVIKDLLKSKLTRSLPDTWSLITIITELNGLINNRPLVVPNKTRCQLTS